MFLINTRQVWKVWLRYDIYEWSGIETHFVEVVEETARHEQYSGSGTELIVENYQNPGNKSCVGG